LFPQLTGITPAKVELAKSFSLGCLGGGSTAMFDDLEPKTANPNLIELGSDLSTLSVGDLDDRIELLKVEIKRLTTEREQKTNNLSAAEAFFKN